MSLLSSFFGTKPKTASEPTTALDLVTFAAGLASDQSKIDPLLDKVRAISSKLGPGQQPSEQDVTTLLGVYVQIEHYLTTNEPIRNFTQTELRAKISPPLRVQLEQNETTKKGA